jgi:hypothetical protein
MGGWAKEGMNGWTDTQTNESSNKQKTNKRAP